MEEEGTVRWVRISDNDWGLALEPPPDWVPKGCHKVSRVDKKPSSKGRPFRTIHFFGSTTRTLL